MSSWIKFWIVDKRHSNIGRPCDTRMDKPPSKTKLMLAACSERAQARRDFNVIRDNEFIALYKQGMTLDAIGKQYGLSRERVRQRLKIHGISWEHGGIHLSFFVKIIDKMEKSKVYKERWIENTKCSNEFFQSLGGHKRGTAGKAFIDQKRGAGYRGIEWKLTLHEWWDFWQESGHWEERGIGSGKYVMARECDSGAYELGNIKIITHNENSKESRLMDKVYNRTHCLSFKKSDLTVMCEEHNINVNTVRARIKSGWDIDRALNEPVGRDNFRSKKLRHYHNSEVVK